MWRCRALAVIATLSLGVAGCAQPWQSEFGRDHPLADRIWDVAGDRSIDQADLFEGLSRARFVLVGETHDNPDHHVLQARVIAAIAAFDRRPAVGFEMLSTVQSDALAAHLARAPKDAAGLGPAVGWAESGWPEWTMYRPIAQAALDGGLPLFAANLDPSLVHGLAREGLGAVDSGLAEQLGLADELPEGLAQALAAEIKAAHCGFAPDEAIDRMVLAQRARDAHMAHSLLEHATADGALLIAGNGHVRSDFGVPYHLAQLAPDERVMSLGLLEVATDMDEPADYAEAWEMPRLPFDFVWFTPRVDDRGACERFRDRLEKMHSQLEPAHGWCGRMAAFSGSMPSPACLRPREASRWPLRRRNAAA